MIYVVDFYSFFGLVAVVVFGYYGAQAVVYAWAFAAWDYQHLGSVCSYRTQGMSSCLA